MLVDSATMKAMKISRFERVCTSYSNEMNRFDDIKHAVYNGLS